MNSASYCKLVISTALCRVWISTRVLKLINIHKFWKEKKKIKSTDDIMQVGPLMFLFALSLMPLCQTQHPPITLSQAVYSSRYYFARNKSLPLDVSASSHEFNTEDNEESCGWHSGCRATPFVNEYWSYTSLYQLDIYFYFLCNICFWFPGFWKFLSSESQLFRVCWYYVQ